MDFCYALTRCVVAVIVATMAAGYAGANSRDRASDNLIDIDVLSNRADLISGGDALVEIILRDRGRSRLSSVRVDVDGRDVTSAFAVRADGRFYGLITGLRN